MSVSSLQKYSVSLDSKFSSLCVYINSQMNDFTKSEMGDLVD